MVETSPYNRKIQNIIHGGFSLAQLQANSLCLLPLYKASRWCRIQRGEVAVLVYQIIMGLFVLNRETDFRWREINAKPGLVGSSVSVELHPRHGFMQRCIDEI